MTQYHFIFHETLRENLRVAKPDATDKEMIQALEKAHLKPFFSRLRDGLNEVMDPRGMGIRGGEKQRICIRLFLLKNSPIMILDEPWSELDESARDVLAEVINTLRLTTTILILTHDNLPNLAADRIFRLIPERGIFISEKP